MSRIPKKKSRPITVNDREYRWLLKGTNRYRGRSPGVLNISIQETLDKPGQTLTCTAISDMIEEAEEECGSCTTQIFVSDVREIILRGLEDGWTPREGNGSFVLKNLRLKEYEIKR